ncbi:GAF domain-containing sensor histidine kinase [Leptolyngbya sp. FACHB-17]|uniref:GAF domain-containing sensor histidine kinase n=1 Tax=unclassified Leptolyngbya TaxID=2650499 RepID=UPI001681A138|nr:GAF domain-containing sensor histidine kinase [Leptolyngbya sp. FACHB-17]MBD2080189.1 GAF domain-containing protein [Leptolyngbya sp. FACHB-17]
MINRQSTPQPDQKQSILDSLATLSYRAHDLSRYLHEITCGVNQLLNSDWTIVTLYEGATAQVIASNLEMKTEAEFALHGKLAERVIQSGQPFFAENAGCEVLLEGYSCYLGVPLRTAPGEIVGTICSFSRQLRHYTQDMFASVELFAERAATAIDNYRLYQQQQQFNELLEAEVVKRTLELRAAQAKLIEQERLAAIGEFAAMIVHEIRNPLTTVQLGLNHFAKLDLPGSAQARLSLATSEAERLANLLDEILLYSKPQVLQLAEIEINAFIQELLILLRSMPEAQERLIVFVPWSSPICILGDADKLKQVFINLIRNACEAVDPDATIRWTVTLRLDQLDISIQNGGVPIAHEVLPRLTEPFYSTKAEGTGLGLAIVKRIVEAHRGSFSITSSDHEGTIVQVQFPL